MKKALKVRHVAEIWNKNGPTGNFAEVSRGEIQDYGGNTLYRGTADQCLREKASFAVPCRMIPTHWTTIDGEVADADYVWQFVLE